jgi:hypothetical protein
VLAEIRRLRRSALPPSRDSAACGRAIALPSEAAFAEVEAAPALLTSYRPDTNRHGLSQAERETGRSRRNVRRTTRRPRPRGDTGGSEGQVSDPHLPAAVPAYQPLRPPANFGRLPSLLWHSKDLSSRAVHLRAGTRQSLPGDTRPARLALGGVTAGGDKRPQPHASKGSQTAVDYFW